MSDMSILLATTQEKNVDEQFTWQRGFEYGYYQIPLPEEGLPDDSDHPFYEGYLSGLATLLGYGR